MTKRPSFLAFLALIVTLACAGSASGQGTRFDGVVQSRAGFPAPGASIAVCRQPAVTTTQPCSPLATLYTDSTLTTPCAGTNLVGGSPGTPCSNPLIADGLGNYHYYITPGKYTVQFYGPGLTPYAQPDQILSCDPSNCTFQQVNGCQIVNASQTFAQALANVSIPGCIEIAPSPTPYPISVNPTTVPTTVGLSVNKGGILNAACGVPNCFTINSAIYASPDTQIFQYTGSATIGLGGSNAVVSSAWWGTGDIGTDISRALLALQTGGGNAGGWVDARHYTALQTSSTNAFAGVTIPFTLYPPCTSITLSVPWIHQGSQQFVEGCINNNPAEIIAVSSWPQIVLTGQSQTLTTVTGTTSTAHGFSPHQLVCISGTTDPFFTEGCVFLVTASGTTFTWTSDISSTRSSTGGIVSPPLVGVGTDASGALSRVRWSRVNLNCNGRCGTTFANVGGEEGSGLDTWVSTNFVGYGVLACGSAAIVNFSNFPSNNKYSTGHILYNSGSNNLTGFSAYDCGTGGHVNLENTTIATNSSPGTGNIGIEINHSNMFLAGNHIESVAFGVDLNRNSSVVISDLTINPSVTTSLRSDANGNSIDADFLEGGGTNTVVNSCPGGHTLTGTIVHYRASSNCQENWTKDDGTKTFNVGGNLGLSGTIQNLAPGAAATMGMSVKGGTGAGDYTGTNTAYVSVDTSALCQVVTIPTGWKLSIAASGNISSNTAIATVSIQLSDVGTTCGAGGITGIASTERTVNPTVIGATGAEVFATNGLIVGDGLAHAISLQAKTSNAADAWRILNNTSIQEPSFVLILMPSN